MSSRATYCSVNRSTIMYAYEYQCRQWQSRTCPNVPARLARDWCYRSKIAKISNFTLLCASRLRKDRLIDFRNLFTILFGYSSRRKWVIPRICALPLVLTRSLLIQYPNSLFALKRARFACHAPFFGSLSGSARKPEPRIAYCSRLSATANRLWMHVSVNSLFIQLKT